MIGKRGSVALIVAGILAFPAAALPYASLQLSPRSVTLSATQRVGQIAMNSLDARDLIFDLQAVTWTQRGDADSFTPTNDLTVVPPVYDAQPFRRVLVRFGSREQSADTSNERAYQIQFREVLPAGSNEKPRTLTAPVFLAPAQPHGEVKYTLQRTGEKNAKLVVDNQANAHVYLGTIRIESGGQEVYSGSLGAYVLAANSRSFSLELAQPLASGEAQLSIEGEENSATTVDVPVQ